MHRLGKKSLSAATQDLPGGGLALLFGASGGIGSALSKRLRADSRFAGVVALSRSGSPPLDLLDEASIAAAADNVAAMGLDLRLLIVATGVLEGEGCFAEKSWRHLDAQALAQSFAVNTIGPALLIKHFMPLLPRSGRCVFAALSARVGSIGDNRLGGWYGYRAAKAALNQILRSAAVELKRSRPEAICVALHPGPVDTGLTAGFGKHGLEVQTPDIAAARIINTFDRLRAADSGGFFDQHGRGIPW
ncbi:MAG: SDR family NAD(P)-dependent oxidoreductase [Burkholderiales bacterium]|nr:SDR family NAD(P)-dependent oxidoreductase [Burkholderiales bacterium]MDP2398286.1 SDR family NAD(P)-dependent oxidoreductase [Burkholderiales bacterium]